MGKADLAPVALKAGILAYYDTTFNGLIPCKVLKIVRGPGPNGWAVLIRLTTTRKAYKRGELLTIPADEAVPRDKRCVYRRDYQIRVRHCWHVEHDGKRHEIFASAVE